MAKRFLLVSVFAAIVAGGAFAQVRFSAGAGYIYSTGNMGATTRDSGSGVETLNYHKGQQGGFLFLDATYVELSLGLMSGAFSSPGVGTYKNGNSKYDTAGGGFDILSMDIGLLGRYPIRVAKITVSPLLGVGYNLVLSAKHDTADDIGWGKFDYADGAGDYSTIRIMLGAGADFDVTDRIFARAECAAHYALAPEAIAKVVERDDDYYKRSKSKGGGFGVTYTFAVGYRF